MVGFCRPGLSLIVRVAKKLLFLLDSATTDSTDIILVIIAGETFEEPIHH